MIFMPANNTSSPPFSWNDIGNRFLWLGYLLSQLDASYKDAKIILLKPNDAHKDAIAEIIEWQNQLMLTLSCQSKAQKLGDFFISHKLPAIPNNEQIRVICVVFFRQTFMHLRDTLGMPLARIASPHRTIDDILRHRNAVEQLFQAGLLFQAKDGGCRYLDLHQGLGDFLLGNVAEPLDKPIINKEEPKPLHDKPCPNIASHLGKPRAEFSLSNYIKSLPLMSPREMAKVIHQEGYIGQDRAVKSVCLLAWRHLNRLKKVYLDGVDYKDLPPKTNALLLGQTGCGKTYLVELLFKILRLPMVIADASNFVETGYVGNHISSIFTRLIQAAGSNEKASLGIVCLDEFDKICSSHSAARFAGQGTTKDLKYGVQCELLKLMESFEVGIPLKLGIDDKMITLDTRNIPLIGCGAFSGLARHLDKQNQPAIGFGANGKTTSRHFKDEINRASSFESYGIIPELFGRFSSVVAFDDLNKDELKAILEKNTIQQYEKELSLNGLGLQVCPDVYDLIVGQCIERQTGARGLQTALVSHLEEALFEAYSTPSQGIRLFVDGERIGWEVIKRRVKRRTKAEEKETLLLASG